jgi:hypothetical protein
MNKNSNIFDPVKDKLDSKIFRGTTPRSNVTNFIEKTIIEKFNKAFDFDVSKYITLYLTGSLTTYQYHDTSDVDINIFVDYNKWPKNVGAEKIRKQLIQVVLEDINGINVPDTQHPLQLFVMQEDIEPRELFDVGVRSAWNFKKKEWIVKPDKDRVINVVNDTTDVYTKAMRISEQMQMLLEENPSEAKKLYKRLHKKRQKDTKMFGDFSEGNIIYKFLDYSGQLDQLRRLDVKIASILKEASLVDVLEKAQDYLEEELASPGSRFYNPDNPAEPIMVKDNTVVAMSIGVEDLEKRNLKQVGLYRTILKMDPDSRQLYNPETKSSYKAWECSCPWGQVSWDRVKRPQYEGRPCSHVYALYWYVQKVPDSYEQEIEGMLELNPPQEVSQILNQIKEEDFTPFEVGRIVAIKPQFQITAVGEDGQQYDLKQGTQAQVIEYHAPSKSVKVMWQDIDNEHTNIHDVNLVDAWYPAYTFRNVVGAWTLPKRRKRQVQEPQIQEAQEPPVINEIP